MRISPLRLILGVVIVIALVFVVRLVACSGAPQTLENKESGLEDPAYTEVTSANGQVQLLGLYANQEESTDSTVRVYFAVSVKSAEKDDVELDAHGGDSFVRFMSVDNTADFNDFISSETAAAFDGIGYKTAAYAFENTVQGTMLSPRNPTKIIAVMDVPRETLANAKTLTLWFDDCTAVHNEPTSAVGFQNVTLDIPAEMLRTMEKEDGIIARLK